MKLEPETGPERERQLEEVVRSFLLDEDAGRAPDPQAVIARHPHLAAELRDFFAGQELLRPLVAKEPIDDGQADEGRRLARVGVEPVRRSRAGGTTIVKPSDVLRKEPVIYGPQIRLTQEPFGRSRHGMVDCLERLAQERLHASLVPSFGIRPDRNPDSSRGTAV